MTETTIQEVETLETVDDRPTGFKSQLIEFWSYFSEEKKQLDRLAADGLIEYDPTWIRVTPIGRIFVRHVGMAFDRYIRERKTDGPRFSKTV